MDINPDVVAWVYVPNTGIDYPVMQEPEWGKYQYLYSDIYKKYCVSGSLFIPAKPKDTDIKLDAHIIIYGHNMKNGSMFSTLSYYKEEDFYKSSPYVYVYYPDRTERWAIWAVAHISSQSGSYEDPVALGSDEYKAALEEFDSLRYYDTNVSGVTAYTRTLTLSTCDWTYTNHDGRITVTSVLDKTLIWDD
jgi:sortase B